MGSCFLVRKHLFSSSFSRFRFTWSLQARLSDAQDGDSVFGDDMRFLWDE